MPPLSAARRLGITLETFERSLPALTARGFPPADLTTGNFDLDAIDAWRRSRHPHLFPADRSIVGRGALDAKDVVRERLAKPRD